MATGGGHGDTQCGEQDESSGTPGNIDIHKVACSTAKPMQQATPQPDTADKAPTHSGAIIIHGTVIVGPMGNLNVADGVAKENTLPAKSDTSEYITHIPPNVFGFVETEVLQECIRRMTKEKHLILTGLSGAGKTEIAKCYWEKNKSNYDVGRLLPSGSKQELVIAMRLFLSELNISVDHLRKENDLEDALLRIHTAINKCGKKFLLIFDDSDDDTFRQIEQVFQATTNISVMITTQQTMQQDDFTIHVKGFNDKEAMDFLQKLPDGEDSKRKLCNELSYLPSALIMARFDILNTKETIGTYLDGINKRALYALIEQRSFKSLGISYKQKNGAIDAHVKNAKALMKKLIQGNLAQLNFVLKGMAFLDSQSIPEAILKDILREEHKEIQVDDTDVTHLISTLMTEMKNRSYVTQSDEKIDDSYLIATHNLVQLGIRFAMEETEHRHVIEMLMKVLMCNFDKDTRTRTSFMNNALHVPHVEKVLGHFENLKAREITVDLKVMAIVLYDILGYSYTQGEIREIKTATEKQKQSLDLMYSLLNVDEKNYDWTIRKSYKDEEEIAYEKAKFMFNKLQSPGNKFFDKFVLNTVLSHAEVELMESKAKGGKGALPKFLPGNRIDRKIYNKLVDLDLAIPETTMDRIYLPEIYASVLYTYGRMYFYNKTDEPANYIAYLRLASALCQVIEQETKRVLLLSILTKRNGLLYFYSEEKDEQGQPKNDETKLKDLYKGLEEYKTLLSLGSAEYWYQRGILKATREDFIHTQICLEHEIRICRKLLELEKDPKKKESVISTGKTAVFQLNKVISNPNGEQDSNRKAILHVISADFLEAAKCWNEAFGCYRNAGDTCMKINKWTAPCGKSCESLLRIAKQPTIENSQHAEAVRLGEMFLEMSLDGAKHRDTISTLIDDIKQKL